MLKQSTIQHACFTIANLKHTAIIVAWSYLLKNCRISISFPSFCFQDIPQHIEISQIPIDLTSGEIRYGLQEQKS